MWPLESKLLLEKKITVGKKNYRWNHAKFEKKEASWKKNNKKILKNNILIKQ